MMIRDEYSEAKRRALHRRYKELRTTAKAQPDGPTRSFIQAEADKVVAELIEFYETEIKEREQQTRRTN